MIKLINIYKQYLDKVVIDDLNYTFLNKGLYYLKGDSGSGKTTLFNIISNRCEYEGEVLIDKDVFYLSFNNYLIEEFKVKDNIELHKDVFSNFNEYKNRLDIDKLMNKKISRLSIGEKQRVGLFLALSSNCKIILLDEIFSGVDEQYKKIFLKEIKRASKTRLVIITSHQDFYGYDYLLHLENGKIKEKCKEYNVLNNSLKYKLTKSFKWAKILHKKQFLQRLIFLFSIIGNGTFYENLKVDLEGLLQDFNSSFINNTIYYKESKHYLNDNNFYNEIVFPLANEIKDYGYNFYSEGMYNSKVILGDSYLMDGNIFSKVDYVNGIQEDEIILVMNPYKYCLNFGDSYCNFNQIKERVIGNTIKYRYKDKALSYLIKDVEFSKNEGIVVSYDNEIIKRIEQFHADDNSIKKYYIVVSDEKLDSFFDKINTIDSLLNYNFNFLYKDNGNNYFLITDIEYKYFSEEELNKENVIACSDYSYSCSSIDFGKFKSIYYIDNIEVKDKIFYEESMESLHYNEIVISSSLSRYINKDVGNIISLRFYIEDSFYVLEDVRIVDVIDNEKLTIYHSDYDYNLFKEKFNQNVRIAYLYSDKSLSYSKMNCFHYELISETKDSINRLINFIKICTLVFVIIMIVVLFIVEFNGLKKYMGFFEFLSFNNRSFNDIYKIYILLYIFVGFLFNNLILSFTYYGILLIFYFVNIAKIKSRLNLD